MMNIGRMYRETIIAHTQWRAECSSLFYNFKSDMPNIFALNMRVPMKDRQSDWTPTSIVNFRIICLN